MAGGFDFSGGFDQWFDLTSASPAEGVERSFWLDLWRSPTLDAVEEMGIETRRYGPVLAMMVERCQPGALLNPVLGAGETGAVEEGHLEEALDWLDSLGVDFRIPITMEDHGESGAAEELLNRRGFVHDECLVRFARPGAVDFSPPPGIEVMELEEPTEGFSDFIGEALGLDPSMLCFLDCLPGRSGWRCYMALEKEHGHPIGSACMMTGYEVARLGFTGVRRSERCRGAHRALLHRRLSDAKLQPWRPAVAEVMESLDGPPGTSPAARNLRGAGFKQVAVRPVWRPPVD